MNLADKIVELHQHLQAGDIPHAFGGALALAWCTKRARGTIDIDVNLFVPVEQLDRAVSALPQAVAVSDEDRTILKRDGQARLWWDATPVDVFFNTTDFHEAAAGRARWEDFAGHRLPFLACADLAVFKAFFDRTKDWADLEEMANAATLDFTHVFGVLVDYLGADDPRIERVRRLRPDAPANP